MPVGVYIACGDPFVADSLAHALGGSEECYAAPALDGADVVLAEPAFVPADLDAALVVLAADDPIAAARFALARGADGIAVWPDEPASLARIVGDAAMRRRPGRQGTVVAVVGTRGGAGATTVAAHLAAVYAPDALLIDGRGGPSGQALFATGEASVTLADARGVVAEPSPGAIRALAAPHASGAMCLFGGVAPPPASEPFVECLRGLAPVVIVDGPAPRADITVLVCGADVGSVRSAAAMLPDVPGRTEIVLTFTGRGRVRPRQARRALGVERVTAVPADPWLARAGDAGRMARRGPGRRALRRFARSLEPQGMPR